MSWIPHPAIKEDAQHLMRTHTKKTVTGLPDHLFESKLECLCGRPLSIAEAVNRACVYCLIEQELMS